MMEISNYFLKLYAIVNCILKFCAISLSVNHLSKASSGYL